MDHESFRAFLKKQRRSQGTIENCLRFSAEFDAYLVENCEAKGIEEASIEDFESFTEWLKEQGKSPNSYLWGIGRYYEFSGNEEMRKFASGWRRRLIDKGRGRRKGLSLRKIAGVETEQIEKLADVGVRDATGLLEVGKTKTGRETLALESGVPEEYILELVKMADLTRIVDIKAVRVRLLYDAGIDTLIKLSGFTPDALQVKLTEVNQEKKYLKRNPTLVETTYWIVQAKEISKIVEY